MTPVDRSVFEALLTKYLHHTLNEEEVKYWHAMLRTEQGRTWFFEFAEKKALSEGHSDTLPLYMPDHLSTEVVPPDWDDLWEKILATTAEQKSSRLRIIWNAAKTNWIRIAAVLFITAALTAITGTYLTNSKRQGGSAKVMDIAPGYDGAILELADGSKVLLDSTGNGVIAQQGNVKIQHHNGEIIYHHGSGDIAAGDSHCYNTMRTPRGRQFKLILPDGTNVWLNAASSIVYPVAFKGPVRHVKVTGEAYFEVAHNAKMPFVVQLNDVKVKVLGTHFNVNDYSDDAATKVTLLEGSVLLERPVTHGTIHHETNKLVPGQQALLDQSGGLQIKKVDVSRVVAWKNGMFDFNGMNLKEVMSQIARWYDVEVQYPDKLPNIQFNGQVHRNINTAQLFEILGYFGVHFKIEAIDGKSTIVVLPE